MFNFILNSFRNEKKFNIGFGHKSFANSLRTKKSQKTFLFTNNDVALYTDESVRALQKSLGFS
jgi:hypothetical protein